MDNIVINETNPELNINVEENNIAISEEVNEITIEETNTTINLNEETPEISLVFNERGATGNSAYKTWLEQGNIGTEEEFIASLKGEKGDKGDTADFYKIISQVILNGYTQSSTLENNKLYTYIRDTDNIVIDTIITEV